MGHADMFYINYRFYKSIRNVSTTHSCSLSSVRGMSGSKIPPPPGHGPSNCGSFSPPSVLRGVSFGIDSGRVRGLQGGSFAGEHETLRTLGGGSSDLGRRGRPGVRADLPRRGGSVFTLDFSLLLALPMSVLLWSSSLLMKTHKEHIYK